jgi:hypothetical protein
VELVMRRRLALCALAWLLAGAARAESLYGDYPDCVAPALPLETHSWWREPGETVPQHLHSGTCLPHARDLTGELVAADRPFPFSVRAVLYHNPGPISWVRWQWVGDTQELIEEGWVCDGASGVPAGPSGELECVFFEELHYDPSTTREGMEEIRVTPNVPVNSFGKRQFASHKNQLWAHPGGTLGSRDRPWPIGSSWYEGLGYCNVAVGITELFRGEEDLGRTLPLVTGEVAIPVDHYKCEGVGATRSAAWLDPDFHWAPTSSVRGAPDAPVALYDLDGLFEGSAPFDSRSLCDGVHVLYFASEITTREGALHQGALKTLVETRNGNAACADLSVCVERDPAVAILPASQAGMPGAELLYAVRVTSRDSPACAPRSFGLVASLPASLSGVLGEGSLGLAPGATASTSLRVSTGSLEGQHAFTVEASSGSSAGSASALAVVDGTPPSAPTLTATIQSKTQVKLSWSGASDAGGSGVAGYRIHREGGSGPVDYETTATSYLDKETSAGTTYTYTVKALDAAGNRSPASNAVTLTVGSKTRR